MATERPKAHETGKPPPDDDPEERPTLIPKFDPAELARRTADSSRDGLVRRTTPLGSTGIPDEAYRKETRPELSTISNEAEIESARRASLESERPPETMQMSESMGSSLLSMADSRVQSGRPQAPELGEFSKLDKAWENPTLDEPPTKPSHEALASSDVMFGRKTSRLRAGSNDEVPPSSQRLGRDESFEAPAEADADNTIFSPARAAAALRAPSSRPPTPTPPNVAAALEQSPEETILEMRDRFSLGDYTGALVLAEGLLEDLPNNVQVKECAENCRQVLRQMYTARIGPLDRVPVVTVAHDQLRWLSIDHRAGFVLSHIDGVSSLEMILDVSGMPLLDALRILCELAQQRIISFR